MHDTDCLHEIYFAYLSTSIFKAGFSKGMLSEKIILLEPYRSVGHMLLSICSRASNLQGCSMSRLPFFQVELTAPSLSLSIFVSSSICKAVFLHVYLNQVQHLFVYRTIQ